MNKELSVQQLFDLSKRTALITGASGHLGSAMASALAEAGARVVVSSRNAETGSKAAASLGGKEKGRHLSVVIDHMDEQSISHGFEQALKAAGQIDILVCNGHEALGADWRSVSGEQFNRQLQNATGYFLLARAFHAQTTKRHASGSIVMIGSMYGVVGSYPMVYEGISSANPLAYQALKGGIVQMVRHLAVYWAKDRIRVNCLSPGPFPSSSASAELIDRLRAHSPLGRLGEPHELKGALIFLTSDASSYVTGHNLLIDGGWTAW